MLSFLTHLFPLWVLTAALLALWQPVFFTWFSGPLIPLGLGVIMLGMGLTLTVEDFRRLFKMPGRILMGTMLQYTLMPFLGWSLAAAFKLPPALAAGLILVACCPGGTASNVVTYLAKADVPLSVSLTAFSTLLAAVMTPALTSWLVGSRVEVSFLGLLRDTVQIVILPVVLGAGLNRFCPQVTQRVLPLAPLTAVIFITLIVSSIVGMGKDQILKSGFALIGAVGCLHAGGFLLGYAAALLLTRDRLTARTLSIEVGMQNSGLGVVLAQSNFASPLTAIPCAISSVFHSLIGSLLAAHWRGKQAGLDRRSGFYPFQR